MKTSDKTSIRQTQKNKDVYSYATRNPNTSRVRSKSLSKKGQKVTDEHLLAVQHRAESQRLYQELKEQPLSQPVEQQLSQPVEQQIIKVDIVKAQSGFYVEKKMLEFVKFYTLVELAFAIIDRGFIIFGSFTHYLAWCSQKEMDPKLRLTARRFLKSGRHIPRDIDVFDPEDRLLSKTMCKCDTIIPAHSEKYDALTVPHMKRIFRIPVTYFGNIDVSVDATFAHTIRFNGLDFDVNSLTYSAAHGLRCIEDERSTKKHINHLLRGKRITKIVDAIDAKQAKFLGTFDSGSDKMINRILFIGRIKKMIYAGFTIEGWNLLYPTYTISHLDCKEDRVCGICYETLEHGEVAQLSPCCSSESRKLMCMVCFWKLMKDLATKSCNYICPFCRDMHIIFGGKNLQPRSPRELSEQELVDEASQEPGQEP